MNVFRKMSAAVLVIASLTAANHAMAACDTSYGTAWTAAPLYKTLKCFNNGAWVTLANFFIGRSSQYQQYGTVNLTGGTWAQLSGMTQGGGSFISGCSAEDFTANNSPVYLNWNGNYSPNCELAFHVRMAAGTYN